jgi:hypothetical protein
MNKKCTKCGRELPLTEFYKFKNTRGGRYYSACKSCYAKYNGVNYLKDIKRNCAGCGKEFQPTRHSPKFCGDKKCYLIKRKNDQKRYRETSLKIFKKTFWEKKLWMTTKPTSINPNKRGYMTALFRYISIPYHRLIIMRKLGRELKIWEHVHHINSNKMDNREENLTLIGGQQHFTVTMAMEENKELRNRIIALEEDIRNLKTRYKLQEVL